MKITEKTIAILKNFATINESIIFKEGSKLNTVSNAGNLMAFVDVEESFPHEAPIYNLNQFLNTISLFDDPDVEFENNHFIITDSNNSSVKYYFASAEVINIPDREPKMKETSLEFLLEQEDLASLTKASGVLNLEDLVLTPDGTDLRLSAVDVRNPTSNNFSRIVGDNTVDGDFELKFKSSSLNLMRGNYIVSISGTTDSSGRQRFLASFKSEDSSLIYYVALDPSSSMENL